MSLKNSSPSAVSMIPFGCRVKSRRLNLSSKAFRCLEREGWLTCSMVAALVTLRCFVTAANAVNCVKVIATLLGDYGSSLTVADTTTYTLKIANGYSQMQ